MEKPTIFVSKKFLKEFHKKYSETLDYSKSFKKSERRQLMDELHEVMHRKSHVIFDFSKSELIKMAEENPHYKLFYKSPTKKEVTFSRNYQNVVEKECSNLKPNIFYFFVSLSSSICQELEDKYGYFFINHPSLNQLKRIFFHEEPYIGKNTKMPDWSFLNKFKRPSNSILIADRYFLKERDKIAHNLYEILKNIMPTNFSGDFFYLTIISDKLPDISSRYKMIEDFLDQTFSYSSKIKFCIILNDKIHNRHLFSNNIIIDAYHGFDIANRSQISIKSYLKTTSSGLFYENSLEVLNDKVKNAFNNTKTYWGLVKCIEGIKENRLIPD